jgi:DNA polymerase-3 subunit gamma/tau
MEQFIVSARKYRPQTFKDVVGQQAITNTLINAIESNHLAQALLFTGPRGVGKTTCARILARKINQEGYDDPKEDFAFNVFELDAASNNSVDDIRNLIDQVRIPPQTGKYKVYIIDEVHMLSSAAFNAFLKTLEEPPHHAIFILATTEKHKIIPTILSRCQIFDFKRITITDATAHLAEVAKNQGVFFEEDALRIIAQKADGAMRDALSIFDRVVSYCGKNLTRQAVAENLNVLDFEYYIRITNMILQNNIPELLLAFDDILAKGFDGHHFVAGMASHFRNLMVCKTPQTVNLLEVGEHGKQVFEQQAEQCSLAFLLQAIEIANDADLKYKASQNQRLLVELCLMQLASLTFDSEKKKVKHFIIPPSVLPDNSVKIYENFSENIPYLKEDREIKEIQNQGLPLPLESHKNISEHIEKGIIRSEKSISALSLSSIRNRKELESSLEKNVVNLNDLPKESFTYLQLMEEWNKYSEKLTKSGLMLMASLMGMAPPTVKESMILIELPNEGSRISFDENKYDLVNYLRKKMNNYDIDIVIEVNEKIEISKKVLGSKDRYEHFVEINSNMELLKQIFDLELRS